MPIRAWGGGWRRTRQGAGEQFYGERRDPDLVRREDAVAPDDASRVLLHGQGRVTDLQVDDLVGIKDDTDAHAGHGGGAALVGSESRTRTRGVVLVGPAQALGTTLVRALDPRAAVEGSGRPKGHRKVYPPGGHLPA